MAVLEAVTTKKLLISLSSLTLKESGLAYVVWVGCEQEEVAVGAKGRVPSKYSSKLPDACTIL